MADQVENLLRPPVELYSALTASCAAIMAMQFPSLFLMPPSVGIVTGLSLALFGAYRFRQGWFIWRYQKRLTRLPHFEMSNDDIPTFNASLYLGRGFQWTQTHVQRLKNTRDPRSAKYLARSRWYDWARNMERVGQYPWLATITSSRAWWNPVRPLPPVGGDPAIHGVAEEERDVFMTTAERAGNLLVVGTTGSGKSRLLSLLAWQDVHRKTSTNKPDSVVVLIDPKGDAQGLEMLYQAAVNAGREKDFRVFHLGYPELSARYNPLGNFSRVTEIASRVSEQLPGEGDSAAFKDFAFLYINIIARALVGIGIRPTYDHILSNITDVEPLFLQYTEQWLAKHAKDDDWRADVGSLEREAEKRKARMPHNVRFAKPRTEALFEYVQNLRVTDPVVAGLVSTIRHDAQHYQKLIASVLPLLSKLTTGQVGELLSPNYLDHEDDRPIIDWASIIRTGGIVYIGLDFLGDPVLAEAVGSALWGDLISTASVIYRHGADVGQLNADSQKINNIFVHADELSAVISRSFTPLISMGRGAGIVTTAYTQALQDLEMGMGSKAGAGVVSANFNSSIMFRVRNRETAMLMSDSVGDVEVSEIMTVSGATDSSNPDSSTHFTSSSQDRVSRTSVPLLDPSVIMSLPKGQAFATMNGGQLYKLRFPLPKQVNADVPATLEKLLANMKRDYRSPGEQWWLRD